MAVLVTVVIALALVRDVNLLPIKQNLTFRLSTKGSILNIEEKSSEDFVRVKKELAKVGWCSKGKEFYKGRCRTQAEIEHLMNNDFGNNDDNVTEVTLNGDLSVIPKQGVSKLDTGQRPGPADEENGFQQQDANIKPKSIGKLESTTQETASDTNTSRNHTEASHAEKGSTDTTLVIDAEEIHWVSPIFLLSLTFLLICTSFFLLTWIFKLLYEYYDLRRGNCGNVLLQCDI